MAGENPTEIESPRPRVLAAVRWGLGALLLLPLLVSLGPANRPVAVPGVFSGADGLLLFEPSSAEDLARVLERLWGTAGEGAVPNLAPSRFPADMAMLGTEDRKRVFVQSVLPHILQTNQQIGRERAALLGTLGRLGKGRPLTSVETAWVAGLARRYRLGEDAVAVVRNDPATLLRELLTRVDEVPVSLALAQAAVESGWGSSRFAVEGNALFGQWVFSGKEGMAPSERPEGASYAVARFGTVADSVEAYVRNLNTLWAYASFRELRAGLRRAKGALDPYKLAQGLLMYSVRREEYVEEVCQVIRTNRFVRFDPADTRFVDPVEVHEILSVSDALRISSPWGGSSRPDA